MEGDVARRDPWRLDSGWAAVIGAVVGGLLTGAVSLYAAGAQRSTAQEQFLHSQALAAYGQVVSTSNQLFGSALTYCREATSSQSGALMRDVDAKNATFYDAIGAISVIGSTEALAAANQAEFDLQVWIANCSEPDKNSSIINGHRKGYQDDMTQFRLAARKDLGR